MRGRAQKLLKAWEYLILGEWRYEIVEPPFRKETILQVQTDHGYVVYCEEILHRMHFRRWWVKNKVSRIYRFTSVCEGHAPDTLKRAVERSVEFSDTSFSCFNESVRKDRMLQAYIDIICSRLKQQMS